MDYSIHSITYGVYGMGMSAPLRGIALPVLSPQVREQEMRLLEQWRLSAKPLEPGRVLASFPVVKLDYSDAVTFQRNQDGKEDMVWDHVLFQGDTPKPTPTNDAEAKRYRVNMSIDYKPSVATIKTHPQRAHARRASQAVRRRLQAETGRWRGAAVADQSPAGCGGRSASRAVGP